MSRQFVAATEPSLAIIQWTTIGSLLDGRLRGSIRIFPRLNWFQVERMCAHLFEYLQSFARRRTIGREHFGALVLFLFACHNCTIFYCLVMRNPVPLFWLDFLTSYGLSLGTQQHTLRRSVGGGSLGLAGDATATATAAATLERRDDVLALTLNPFSPLGSMEDICSPSLSAGTTRLDSTVAFSTRNLMTNVGERGGGAKLNQPSARSVKDSLACRWSRITFCPSISLTIGWRTRSADTYSLMLLSLLFLLALVLQLQLRLQVAGLGTRFIDRNEDRKIQIPESRTETRR